MPSLYIPSTQTMILDYGHRYTHPTTGIGYGRTDYDDPAKLAEIGAFPLTMQNPAEGMSADGWEIVQVGEGYVRRPTGESPIPVPPYVPPPQNEYLKGYYEATKKLRQLAGETVPDNEWVKLEDSQYEATLTQAIINNSSSPANLAIVNATTTKILYTFTQLTLKLQIEWESFTYDGSY